MAEPAAEELQKVKNEEFKVWKRQSPFLYDVCMTRALPAVATSVQWLPNAPAEAPAGFAASRALLAAAGAEREFRIYTTTVDLPDPEAEASLRANVDSSTVRVFEPDSVQAALPAAPLTARASPLDPQLVGVGMRGGAAAIVNLGDGAAQQHKLHAGDVFAVAWSPSEKQLATVGTDGYAYLLDADGTHRMLGDQRAPTGESSPALYCVAYAPASRVEVATAGDDRIIRFWDVRAPQRAVRAITDAHATAVTALEYSAFNDTLVITGSADGAVAVWDARMSSASLVGLQAGAEAVSRVAFSPHDTSVFATGAADGHVRIWDLSMHGYNLASATDEAEGPAELVFLHGGHLAPITDIAWHPKLPWTLASVAEDSLAQVWRVADKIVDADLADLES